MALTTFVHKTHSKVHKFLVKNAVLVLMLLMLIILARGVGQYAFFNFFYQLCFLEMLNFLPIMLKIMPDYASKFYYITILIEQQEMTILSFTRNKKCSMQC